MCNNEPPLCLSKYFAFCPEEFVHFSELALNVVTDRSEKAMSPPIGANEGPQVTTFFLLLLSNPFKNQIQKEKYIIEIKFTREKLEYEKTLKVHNLPIKKAFAENFMRFCSQGINKVFRAQSSYEMR